MLSIYLIYLYITAAREQDRASSKIQSKSRIVASRIGSVWFVVVARTSKPGQRRNASSVTQAMPWLQTASQ